jgi:hypothetical protein
MLLLLLLLSTICQIRRCPKMAFQDGDEGPFWMQEIEH